MKRTLAATTVGLMLGAMLAFIAPAATARDQVNWSISVGAPFPVQVYSPPPVVYVQPQPVYVRPQPVYVQPQPVYIEQEPAYGSVYVNAYGRPYYEDRDWDKRHWKHHHHHRHDQD